MRKLFSLIIICMTISANARQITTDEAAVIASEFFNSTTSTKGTGAQVNVRRVPTKSTSRSVEDNQPYYIFNANDDKGFIIISGDDRAKKILGYSDKGNIDVANMPPQLDAMLSQYAKQITSLAGSVADISWSESVDVSNHTHKLLNTALWSQDYPYNCKCPITSGNKLCLTGCTATAMAIVMKYHNWPETGYRSHSYATNNPELPDILSCDFSKTTFQWDKMGNELTCDSPEDECVAVGNLMFSAAVSINTGFGDEGSFGDVHDIVGALRDYFNYDQSCQIIGRFNFSDSEYLDIIKAEIDALRPVIMGGHTVDKYYGHIWVVDGYDSDNDFLHFNWGWGGYSNGFFSLNATDDSNQFPTNRHIIINIQPNKGEIGQVVPYVESPSSYALNEGLKGQGGLRLSTSSIHPREKFDAMIKVIVMPPKSEFEFYLALMDENEDIIDSSFLAHHEFFSDGRGRLELFYPNISFDNIEEINPDWRIQLCARMPGENQPMIPLAGGIDAPSGFPVNAIKTDVSTVEIATDGLTQIRLTPSWDFNNAECLTGGDVYSTITGANTNFIIEPIQKLDDHIITLLYNGDYDVNINSTPMSIWEADRNLIRGAFISKPETSKLEIRYEPMPEKRNLELIAPGTISSLISKEEARTLTQLTLSGKINAQDIWYITRNFQSLTSLDLKKASIVESENESVPNYFDHQPFSYQPENYLPDECFWGMRRLSEVYLPESLEKIGYMAMQMCGITSLVLPEKLTFIDVSFMRETPSTGSRPLSVYCKNPEPPFMPDGVMADTEAFDKGILYVPTGSAEKYRNALTWKKFKTIREMTRLPDAVEISKNNLQLKTGETIQLTAGLLPADATEQRLVWSSDHESIASIDRSGLVTAISEGEAIISVRPEYGDIFAQCRVQVSYESSGLENISTDIDGYFDIYSINGILPMHNSTLDDINSLRPGIYLLRQGTTVTKFVVR